MKYFFLILVLLSLSQSYQIGYVNVGYSTALNPVVSKTSFSQMVPLNWTTPETGVTYFMRIFGSDYSTLDYLSFYGISNILSPSNGGASPGQYSAVLVTDIINVISYFEFTTRGHTAIGFTDPRTEFGTAAITFGGITNGTTLNDVLHLTSRGSTSISFKPVTYNGLGRAHHTAVLIETVNPTNSSSLGSVYFWGGIDGISGGTYSYTNALIRLDLPLLGDERTDMSNVVMTSVTQTGTPSARAGHSAVLYNGNMVIFGGHDGSTYFNGIHSCDLATFSWLSNTPADIARAYHSATMIGDYMYVFGGTSDGSTVLSDLMYYDFTTETWTVVEMLDVIPARAGHATLQVGDSIIVHGGTDFTDDFDDWWVISPNDPECIVYCDAIGDCVNTQSECDSYLSCSGDTPFGCNGECHSSPSSCPTKTCPSGEVLCWNGDCSSSLSKCLPWPACDYGYYRCADGTCKETCDSTTVQCDVGTTLCVDGSCAEECMPYMGCLPDENNVACSDGTCATSNRHCNAECGGRNHCWDRNCRGTCALSAFSTQVVSTDFSFTVAPSSIANPFDVYDVGTTTVDPLVASGQALFVLQNTGTSTLNINGTVRSVSMEEILNAGPYPTWASKYDPFYFISSVISVEVNNIEAKNDGIIAQLFFSPDPTNPEELSVASGCVAQLVDWYWVESIDANNTNPSALIDEEPFKSYYELFNTGNGRAVPSQAQIDAIPTPQKRWKCVEGEFPLTVTTANGEYVNFPGSTIDAWAPTAIIRRPGMPAAIPPPDYSIVQYGISIGFGTIFLCFLAVLLIQVATQDSKF